MVRSRPHLPYPYRTILRRKWLPKLESFDHSSYSCIQALFPVGETVHGKAAAEAFFGKYFRP